MADHVGSYRVEPDRAFADRLERELVRRLEVHRDASVGPLAAAGTVIDVPATERYVPERGLGRGKQRRRPPRSRPVMVAAAATAVAATVVAAAVVVRRDADVGRATGLAGNGLIAFVDESAENPATSDIYVVAPDGTGLRALTSTPADIEYAPAWSSDGSRLAFVRTSDEEFSAGSGSWPCQWDCQLVVIDPSTGVETFSTDIAAAREVPYSLAWSPDGRAITIASNFRDGFGNVGGGSWRIVDLESGSVSTFPPTYEVGWSPDGEWLTLYEEGDRGTSLLLVPADRIPTGGVVDVAGLPGVRSLLESPESDDFDGSVWMPDGSAMLGTSGDVAIDVVTVADGERRTLIEDGFDPVVSPDGGQIAYSRAETPSGVREIWVAAADGSDQRRVTTASTSPAWSPDGSLLLARDHQGWFTVRPDGTDRTALGIRDHTLFFPRPRTLSSGIDWQPAGRATAPAGNGLIAFVGESDDNAATSDIYVVAPDGTGLRALTSTPGLVEYAPAWSPDGSRLAFVRTSADDFSLSNQPCRTDCQLVVVDPTTGGETFSADIPQTDGAGAGDVWVPRSLAWSPDGRAIVIPSIACGEGGCGTHVGDRSASTPAEACFPGGCGGINSVIADLETGAFTTFRPPYQAVWSRDGAWLALAQSAIVPGPSVLLVPADLIRTGDVIDLAELPGVRPLPEHAGDFDSVEWMPDGSAMLVSGASIDVVTVAGGERRTLIEDGHDPVVSPDGGQIAYLRGDGPGLSEIWVAAADGSDPRRVTFSLTPPAWSPDGSLLLAADSRGWFTVRPNGTDRTALGIRDRTPPFPLPGVISSGIDWQHTDANEQ